MEAKILSLDTKITCDFGGWYITKNENLFYMGVHSKENEKPIRTLQYFDDIAKDGEDWKAIEELALISYVYQRKSKGVWVLVDIGNGFA